MQINTVKQYKNNYIVNGLFSIPTNESNAEYELIRQWIDNGGIAQPEFTDDELLQKAKKRKIGEVINLRNIANTKSFIGQSAYKIVDGVKTDEIVAFAYSTTPTGQPLTEPANILFATLIASSIDSQYFTPYSTTTVENGEITNNKVVICLDRSVAIAIQTHLAHRSSKWVTKANLLEGQINSLQTVSEVEALDITNAFI